jgi:hypothetical protein
LCARAASAAAAAVASGLQTEAAYWLARLVSGLASDEGVQCKRTRLFSRLCGVYLVPDGARARPGGGATRSLVYARAEAALAKAGDGHPAARALETPPLATDVRPPPDDADELLLEPACARAVARALAHARAGARGGVRGGPAAAPSCRLTEAGVGSVLEYALPSAELRDAARRLVQRTPRERGAAGERLVALDSVLVALAEAAQGRAALPSLEGEAAQLREYTRATADILRARALYELCDRARDGRIRLRALVDAVETYAPGTARDGLARAHAEMAAGASGDDVVSVATFAHVCIAHAVPLPPPQPAAPAAAAQPAVAATRAIAEQPRPPPAAHPCEATAEADSETLGADPAHDAAHRVTENATPLAPPSVSVTRIAAPLPQQRELPAKHAQDTRAPDALAVRHPPITVWDLLSPNHGLQTIYAARTLY